MMMPGDVGGTQPEWFLAVPGTAAGPQERDAAPVFAAMGDGSAGLAHYLRRHRPDDPRRAKVVPDSTDARRFPMTALPLARIAAVRDGGRFLRFALRLDAAASAALGLLGLAAAAPLTGLLGTTTGALLGTGAFLVGYALLLLLIAARQPIPRSAAWAVVVGNVLWVLGSIGAVVAGWDSLTALGVTVVLAQAAAVAVFADLQWLGLRRAR
jgi:hypothetical protein